MLLEFRIRNFRSFVDEQFFEMSTRGLRTVHPKDGDWESSVHHVSGVFGANASGKSNLLLAIVALRKAIVEGDIGLIVPHAQHAQDPTVLNIRYVDTSTSHVYEYELVVRQHEIVSESLSVNPKGRWRLVFDRRAGDVVFGSGAKIPARVRTSIEVNINPTTTALHAWGRGNVDSGPFIGAEHWWHRLKVLGPSVSRGLSEESLTRIFSDQKSLALVLEAIRTADVGIKSLALQEVTVPDSLAKLMIRFQELAKELVEGVPPEEIEYVSPTPSELEELKSLTLNYVHSGDRDDFELDMSSESDGTLTWMNLIVPVIDALINGRVLIVDELDENLHTYLVGYVIQLFKEDYGGATVPQLIFSAHDPIVLNDALDKAEVWFVGKKNARSSLYRLTDFDVRDGHNITKRYLQGAYDAVPFPAYRLPLMIRSAVKEQMEADSDVAKVP